MSRKEGLDLLVAVRSVKHCLDTNYAELIQDKHYRPANEDLTEAQAEESAFQHDYAVLSGELHQCWIDFLRSNGPKLLCKTAFTDLLNQYNALPDVPNSDALRAKAKQCLAAMKFDLSHFE